MGLYNPFWISKIKNIGFYSGSCLQEYWTIYLCEVLQAVQKLVDEEFEGIIHLRTSTLHKKIASARHDFIKLSGSENKLEALLQVFLCHAFLVLVIYTHK